jgi:integrase
MFLRSKLTKKGYPLADSTIEHRLKAIRALMRRVNLWDKDAVETFIDQANWTNGRKEHVSLAYLNWCESKGFEYKPKKYRRQVRLPYIPTEKEIDQLIGGFSNSKYGPYLQLLKETAFRPVEASRLKPSDFDLDRRIVTLNTPAKNSNPRQVKLSPKLVRMLTPLIVRTNSDEKIWNPNPAAVYNNFMRLRNNIADRLGNPRLRKISLKTFRHWKASMLYHETKDILYVQNFLGHKSIQNTLVYTHLVEDEPENNFIIKVASTLEEYTSLLEHGFEYISDYDDKKILRKRK